jgi:nicotinamide-nucleotide amidase
MKNCLVIIRNKKLNFNLSQIEEITSIFSASGYYFDKIAYVPYDSSQEISSQLKDACDLYDNTLVICDVTQVQMVTDFINKILDANLSSKGANVLGDGAYTENNLREVIADWNRRGGISYDRMYIKTVGAPVSLINQAISECSKIISDVAIHVYESFGDATIVITYTSETPKMVADNLLRIFVTKLDDYIYALEDVSLAERLYYALKLRRMKISVAESFTGGGVCKRLVDVPGVSEVFFEGLNTYSNEAKMSRLGVNEITLKQYGAVSDKTAKEMAEGLINTGNCDISIATTGIAGPKSDNTKKPVGLNYIAIGRKEGVDVYEFKTSGDRQTVTQTAINNALFLAYKSLK